MTADRLAPEDPGAIVCSGAIGADAVALRSDLAIGTLHVEGEQLAVVETGGRVLRIDRCSGDAVELASGLGAVASSALMGKHVWILSTAAEQPKRLVRVPMNGASIEVVGVEASATNLVTDGTALYFLTWPDASNVEVFSLVEGATKPLLLASIPSRNGYGLRLLEASAAGLYFTQDCDCAPSLQQLPHGASELSLLEGAGAVGVWGNYSIERDHDRLYVGVNNWSGGDGIRRLPIAGGEPELLVPAGSGWSAGFAVNMKALCWVDGRPDGPRSIRCLGLSDPGQPPRELDRVDSSQPISLGVSTDALYWLRPEINGSNYELIAASL